LNFFPEELQLRPGLPGSGSCIII